MNICSAPLRPSVISPPFLKAHVPQPEPNPDQDPPPAIPPDAPDEVDLPPREEPEKINDPAPNKSWLLP